MLFHPCTFAPGSSALVALRPAGLLALAVAGTKSSAVSGAMGSKARCDEIGPQSNKIGKTQEYGYITIIVLVGPRYILVFVFLGECFARGARLDPEWFCGSGTDLLPCFSWLCDTTYAAHVFQITRKFAFILKADRVVLENLTSSPDRPAIGSGR